MDPAWHRAINLWASLSGIGNFNTAHRSPRVTDMFLHHARSRTRLWKLLHRACNLMLPWEEERNDGRDARERETRRCGVGVHTDFASAMLKKHSGISAAPTAGPRSFFWAHVSSGTVARAPMISTPLIFIRLTAPRKRRLDETKRNEQPSQSQAFFFAIANILPFVRNATLKNGLPLG